MTAGTTRLTVSGARELRSALREMGADLGDMKSINQKIADMVADEARSRVPMGPTGNLRGSIVGRGLKTRGYVKAGTTKRGNVPYAGPIHFGWPVRNISPQPFLYDALDSRGSEVFDMYAKRVGDLVQRVETDTRIKSSVKL